MVRSLIAEFLGTAFLLMAIVGSGIMAANLSDGNNGLALLANCISVGAALVVLITIFAPLSGAHFNPAVSLYFFLQKQLSLRIFCAYVPTQILGAVIGVVLANVMFDLESTSTAQTVRSGEGQWLSECIATFGLIIVIVGTLKTKADFVPVAVGLYILSAFWFTSSTSFANPAVTIGRIFSDTFAGIEPHSALMFMPFQFIGVLAAFLCCKYLWPSEI